MDDVNFLDLHNFLDPHSERQHRDARNSLKVTNVAGCYTVPEIKGGDADQQIGE